MPTLKSLIESIEIRDNEGIMRDNEGRLGTVKDRRKIKDRRGDKGKQRKMKDKGIKITKDGEGE